MPSIVSLGSDQTRDALTETIWDALTLGLEDQHDGRPIIDP